MQLTRRGFIGSLAALGVGLGADAGADTLNRVTPGPGRGRSFYYVHVELGPGPWPRAAMGDHIATLIHVLQLDAPASISAAGDIADTQDLPRDIMLVLHYADGLRVVFVARERAPEAGLVTVRSKAGARDFALADMRAKPPVPESVQALGRRLADEAWAGLRRSPASGDAK